MVPRVKQDAKLSIWSYQIDALCSARLKKKLVHLPSPYDNADQFWIQLPSILDELHPSVRQLILQFRHGLKAPGALLIRNFPLDLNLPETPEHGQPPKNKQTFVSEGCLAGISLIFGTPFYYTKETYGKPIHNLAPVKGQETELSSLGSNVDFGWHTDNCYIDCSPDYNFLLCLRSDSEAQAATCVAEARDACQILPAWAIQELEKHQFITRLSPAWGKKEHWSLPQPVISGPMELPEVRIKLGDTKSLTPSGQKALNIFAEVLDSPQIAKFVYLKPGDMLLIDNRKIVHGRTPFIPKYDGKDRWLQRLFTRTDIWSERESSALSQTLFNSFNPAA